MENAFEKAISAWVAGQGSQIDIRQANEVFLAKMNVDNIWVLPTLDIAEPL